MTLENIGDLDDAEEEKLEKIAAVCINEGIRAKENDFFTAIGSFQIAWALGRYIENVALMDICSDFLLELGISRDSLALWKDTGYQILINEGNLHDLMNYKTDEAA
jgi:hypothetical protein